MPGNDIRVCFQVTVQLVFGLPPKSGPYLVKYKRGDKRQGTLPWHHADVSGQILFDYSFEVDGTLKCIDGNKYRPKWLQFTIEGTKDHRNGHSACVSGTAKLDLSECIPLGHPCSRRLAFGVCAADVVIIGRLFTAPSRFPRTSLDDNTLRIVPASSTASNCSFQSVSLSPSNKLQQQQLQHLQQQQEQHQQKYLLTLQNAVLQAQEQVRQYEEYIQRNMANGSASNAAYLPVPQASDERSALTVFQNRIYDLESLLSQKDKGIRKLQAYIVQLQGGADANVQGVYKALQDSEARCTDLERSLSAIQLNAKTLSSTVEDQQQLILRLKSQMKAMAECAQPSSDQDTGALKRQRSQQLLEEIQASNDAQEAAEQRARELEDMVNSQQEEIAALQRQLEQHSNGNAEGTMFDHLEAQAQAAQLQRQLETQLVRFEEHKQQILEHLEDQRSQLLEEQRIMEWKEQQLEDERQRLKEKERSLDEEWHRLEGKCKEMEQRHLEDERNAAERIKSLEFSVSQLNEERQKLEAQVADMQHVIDEKDGSLYSLKEECDHLQDKLSAFEHARCVSMESEAAPNGEVDGVRPAIRITELWVKLREKDAIIRQLQDRLTKTGTPTLSESRRSSQASSGPGYPEPLDSPTLSPLPFPPDLRVTPKKSPSKSTPPNPTLKRLSKP